MAFTVNFEIHFSDNFNSNGGKRKETTNNYNLHANGF